MLLSTLRLAASLIGVKYEMSKNKGIMLCVENTNQNREQRSSVDLTPFFVRQKDLKRRTEIGTDSWINEKATS